MKKRVYGILILTLLGICVLRWNLPMTNSKVIGIYVITDFDNQNSNVETPMISDTLILNTDNTFSSGFYGIGKYKLKRNLLSTEIDLSYGYEMGKANLKAYFSNKIYEKPKIILNSDLKQYYEKLN